MKGKIRIKGLVAFANRVQRQLSQPVTRTEIDQLRNEVEQVVANIRHIIAARQANVRSLPGPSRRAFQFLRDIKFASFVPVTEDRVPPRQTLCRLDRITSRVEAHCDGLAKFGDNAPVTAQIQYDYECYRKTASARSLTRKSNQHWAWFCLMIDAEFRHRYCLALHTLTETLNQVAPVHPWIRPLVVHFRPTESAYRMRVKRGRTHVVLPTPFIGLDPDQTDSLGRIMFAKSQSSQWLHDLMMSPGYQQIQAELESFVTPNTTDLRGMYHDLGKSFQRVNQDYFSGKMISPKLTWNKVLTVGKFGHYSFSCDTVMISRSLDREDVPPFVLDHVMHHELLHKKHGMRKQGGRSYSHTPEFRAEEREFARYKDADRILQKIARGTRC